MSDPERPSSSDEAVSEPDDSHQRDRRAVRRSDDSMPDTSQKHKARSGGKSRLSRTTKVDQDKAKEKPGHIATKGKDGTKGSSTGQSDSTKTGKATVPRPLMSIAIPVARLPRIPLKQSVPGQEKPVQQSSRGYPCPDCSQIFRHRPSLHRHAKSAHTGRCWRCPPCQRVFSRRYNLMAHQLRTGHVGMDVFLAGKPDRSPSPLPENPHSAIGNRDLSRSSSWKRRRSLSSPSSTNCQDRWSRDSKPTAKKRHVEAAKGRPSPPVSKSPPTQETKEADAKPTSTIPEPILVTLDRSPGESDLLEPGPDIHLYPATTPIPSDEERDPDPKQGCQNEGSQSLAETLEQEIGDAPVCDHQLPAEMVDTPPSNVEGHVTTQATTSNVTFKPLHEKQTRVVPATAEQEVQTTPSLIEALVNTVLAKREVEVQAKEARHASSTATLEPPKSPTVQLQTKDDQNDQPWRNLEPIEFRAPPRIYRDPRLLRDPRLWQSEMFQSNMPPVPPWYPERDSMDARSRGETGPGGLIQEARADKTLSRAQLQHTPKSTSKDWSMGYHSPTPALLYIWPLETSGQMQATKVKQCLDDQRRGLLVQDSAIDSPGLIDVESLSSHPASPQNEPVSPPRESSHGHPIVQVQADGPNLRTEQALGTPDTNQTESCCSTCCSRSSCCSRCSTCHSNSQSPESTGRESTQLASPTSTTRDNAEGTQPTPGVAEVQEEREDVQESDQDGAQPVAPLAQPLFSPPVWRPWESQTNPNQCILA